MFKLHRSGYSGDPQPYRCVADEGANLIEAWARTATGSWAQSIFHSLAPSAFRKSVRVETQKSLSRNTEALAPGRCGPCRPASPATTGAWRQSTFRRSGVFRLHASWPKGIVVSNQGGRIAVSPGTTVLDARLLRRMVGSSACFD